MGGDGGIPCLPPSDKTSLPGPLCQQDLSMLSNYQVALYRFASISTSYSTSPFMKEEPRVSPAPKETSPIFLSPTGNKVAVEKKAKNGREEERESSSHQVDPTPAKASQGLVWATIRSNNNPSRNLPPHITSFHPVHCTQLSR